MRKLPLMKRSVLLSVAISALSFSAFAQRSRVPAFDQYPATVEKLAARNIAVRTSPGARTFKTRLTEALTEALNGGVNFAGHYIYAGYRSKNTDDRS
jgi:hypothetical protein